LEKHPAEKDGKPPSPSSPSSQGYATPSDETTSGATVAPGSSSPPSSPSPRPSSHGDDRGDDGDDAVTMCHGGEDIGEVMSGQGITSTRDDGDDGDDETPLCSERPDFLDDVPWDYPQPGTP